MRSRRLGYIGAVATIAISIWAAQNVLLERLAQWAEKEQVAYLWWMEEWLQTFQASNYVGRGGNRILLSGPSEAREGLIPEVFDRELPEWKAYQNSISVGTLESFRVLLEYIDRSYGESGFPKRIVVGISPRFVMNHPAPRGVPLINAIDKYSPYWTVDCESDPIRLVPKKASSPCSRGTDTSIDSLEDMPMPCGD